MTIPLNSNTLAAWLAAFSAGTLTPDETVTLFQYMIDDYSVWSMGKVYAEMAEFLLRMGYCLLSEYEYKRLSIPAPACDLAAAKALQAAPHATLFTEEEGATCKSWPEEVGRPEMMPCFWCQSYTPLLTAELIGKDPATGEDMWWCGCVQE